MLVPILCGTISTLDHRHELRQRPFGTCFGTQVLKQVSFREGVIARMTLNEVARRVRRATRCMRGLVVNKRGVSIVDPRQHAQDPLHNNLVLWRDTLQSTPNVRLHALGNLATGDLVKLGMLTS